MKKVLVIAYGFPPMSYAGVFRTLRFCKYLPQLDWQPLVLTIKENPYHNKDYSLMDQLPKNVKIYRTSTIDPAKWYSNRPQARKLITGSDGQEHTNDSRIKNLFQKFTVIKRIKRVLFECATFPDHVIFWIPFALITGIRILVKEKPDIIYTSSPPHSSHLIGLILSKLFRKPWVADFRDPWVDSDYLNQLLQSNIQKKTSIWLEALVIRNAARVVLNTKFNRDAVLQRYRSLDQGKFRTVTNGFDCDDVRGLVPQDNKKFTITFIGTFYSYFKTDLFLDGLKLLVKETGLSNVLNRFQVLFVGGKNSEVEKMIQERELSNIVRCVDYMPKKKAMEICLASHLLLLILGFNKGSTGIVPSKLFDYFLCKKPILAIALEGEMAQLVKESKAGHVISEDNPKLIAQVIGNRYKNFIEKGNVDYSPDLGVIEKYSAQFLGKRLAAIFDEIRT